MRFLSLLLPLTLLCAPALADDGKSLKDHLPSEAESETMISELPDFNKMMDGFMDIAKNEKLRNQLTESAEHMKETLEESGALETRENGLPDINAAMAVMLRMLSDKDGIGGVVDALEDVSKDFESIIEESFEDTPKSPTNKSRLNHKPSESDVGLTDI